MVTNLWREICMKMETDATFPSYLCCNWNKVNLIFSLARARVSPLTSQWSLKCIHEALSSYLIQVYCSLVRPILEYASPVWAALPNCLVQLVESVQKSALGIIFPDCSYESALVRCGLPTLLSCRDEACRRFISNIKESGFLSHLLPQPTNVAHGYGLRSGFSRSEFRFVRTDRLSNFVTHSYNRI